MNTDSALNINKSKKKRVTPIRKTVVEIIFESDSPISAPEILRSLEKRGLSANKTTVYRELDFLMRQDLVQKVNLSPYKIHYEPSYLKHHHHLVCKNCGDIDEIICSELEKPMSKLVRRVSKRFKIKDHNLEFYGYCYNCR
jgi:Fe2+ or Zn2+ uptake regulation protein